MISGRKRKAITFTVLGICLVAAAVTLNVSWLVLNWREGMLIVFGSIFFLVIIAGVVVNTIFLVREIRRNEQHDSFINAVTHELKTPIASIRLYLETLQSREVSDTQRRDFYRVMLADTDRLQQTVEQVLKAGIAGQRASVLHRGPVDISALAQETAETARLRHHLAADAIVVAVATASPSGLLVDGDADELRTAISNLLDNAVKYSRDQIHVAVEIAAPSPDTVWVRVRDRGVGIPRAQLKRIFNRFYRFQTHGFKVKGTGLGLFIVRSIVKQHGGRVFAQSEGEGKGATFTMELPRLLKT